MAHATFDDQPASRLKEPRQGSTLQTATGLWIGLLLLAWCPPAFADQITFPRSLFVGGVTCIPQHGSNGCPNASGATAKWRVVNFFGTANGFASDTDFLNATLTFNYTTGSQVSHWGAIHSTSGNQFVETDPFDIALVRQFTSLTFAATLPQTIFDPLVNGSQCCINGFYYHVAFTANSPVLSSTATSFPPPLDIHVAGTEVDTLVPVPEPATWFLVPTALGLAWLAHKNRKAI